MSLMFMSLMPIWPVSLLIWFLLLLVLLGLCPLVICLIWLFCWSWRFECCHGWRCFTKGSWLNCILAIRENLNLMSRFEKLHLLRQVPNCFWFRLCKCCCLSNWSLSHSWTFCHLPINLGALIFFSFWSRLFLERWFQISRWALL